MKRILPVFLCVAVCTALAFAHSGRTDGDGGHYDHSSGEYHYHHGYPAHQHEDGVCPYGFDDQTGEMPEVVAPWLIEEAGDPYTTYLEDISRNLRQELTAREEEVEALRDQVAALQEELDALRRRDKTVKDWFWICVVVLFFSPFGWVLLDIPLSARKKRKNLERANTELQGMVRQLKEKQPKPEEGPLLLPDIPPKGPEQPPAVQTKEPTEGASRYRREETWPNEGAPSEVCWDERAAYEGGSISKLAGVPEWVEMDAQGLPHTKGKAWTEEDAFIVYTRNGGKVYHAASCSHAAGAERTHVFEAKRNWLKPCAVCKPIGEMPPWYYEYHRIDRIRREQGFEMKP